MVSLTRMGSAKTRKTLATRLLTGWLFLSLALTFTPCCEVFAALSFEDHSVSGAVHGHEAPVVPDPCATWLDNAGYAVTTHAAIVPAGSDGHAIFSAVLLPVARSDTPLKNSLHPGRSPPDAAVPLYLRISRLLI
jgi:hypothetical protein